MSQPTVIEVMRRFLPAYLGSSPPLSRDQRRAIWAMEACRSGDLGGHIHGCATCTEAPRQYSYHSCNHKACPLCGRGTTQRWVRKQDARRIQARTSWSHSPCQRNCAGCSLVQIPKPRITCYLMPPPPH